MQSSDLITARRILGPFPAVENHTFLHVTPFSHLFRITSKKGVIFKSHLFTPPHLSHLFNTFSLRRILRKSQPLQHYNITIRRKQIWGRRKACTGIKKETLTYLVRNCNLSTTSICEAVNLLTRSPKWKKYRCRSPNLKRHLDISNILFPKKTILLRFKKCKNNLEVI